MSLTPSGKCGGIRKADETAAKPAASAVVANRMVGGIYRMSSILYFLGCIQIEIIGVVEICSQEQMKQANGCTRFMQKEKWYKDKLVGVKSDNEETTSVVVHVRHGEGSAHATITHTTSHVYLSLFASRQSRNRGHGAPEAGLSGSAMTRPWRGGSRLLPFWAASRPLDHVSMDHIALCFISVVTIDRTLT